MNLFVTFYLMYSCSCAHRRRCRTATCWSVHIFMMMFHSDRNVLGIGDLLSSRLLRDVDW